MTVTDRQLSSLRCHSSPKMRRQYRVMNGKLRRWEVTDIGERKKCDWGVGYQPTDRSSPSHGESPPSPSWPPRVLRMMKMHWPVPGARHHRRVSVPKPSNEAQCLANRGPTLDNPSLLSTSIANFWAGEQGLCVPLYQASDVGLLCSLSGRVPGWSFD